MVVGMYGTCVRCLVRSSLAVINHSCNEHSALTDVISLPPSPTIWSPYMVTMAQVTSLECTSGQTDIECIICTVCLCALVCVLQGACWCVCVYMCGVCACICVC